MNRDNAMTTVGCVWALVITAFWVGIIVVAWHFVAKFW